MDEYLAAEYSGGPKTCREEDTCEHCGAVGFHHDDCVVDNQCARCDNLYVDCECARGPHSEYYPEELSGVLADGTRFGYTFYDESEEGAAIEAELESPRPRSLEDEAIEAHLNEGVVKP